MKSIVNTVDEYMATVPDDRREAFAQLIQTMQKNLPKGFEIGISYGMVGFCVPHSLYPAGYHCDPKLPLPFVSVANQKAGISLYHMGIYANADLMSWFTAEYPKHSKTKLDIGKSCIRFKKPEQIPFDLIGELMKKMTPKQWIETYERAFIRK